jgi:hypothetical protein
MFNVPSGSIERGVRYQVKGTGTVTYNSVSYNVDDFFVGVESVLTYSTTGSPSVYQVTEIKGSTVAIVNHPSEFPNDSTNIKGVTGALIVPTAFNEMSQINSVDVAINPAFQVMCVSRNKKIDASAIVARNVILHTNSFGTEAFRTAIQKKTLYKNNWVMVEANAGMTTPFLRTRIPAEIIANLKANYALNIAVLVEINNHIDGGATDITGYQAVVDYCNDLKAASPTTKILVVTAFGRNWSSSYATKEGYRVAINNSILTAVSPPWDAVCDLSVNPNIGGPGLVLTDDGVHLTQAGVEEASVLVGAAINAIT